MDSIAVLQIVAINAGALTTGLVYGSGMHTTHRMIFAFNIVFNVWNVIGLLSRLSSAS